MFARKPTMAANEEMYQIPARFRRTENLHIVFWLLKDLCWVMLWRPLGLVMIVPTIGAALLITWQTRHIKSELLHNLAVVFWIFANAYWMITEFFSNDDNLRYYAVIPFSLGILVIAYYYIGAFWNRVNVRWHNHSTS
jgi:prepilin signal peptidase PulO-like enzyme (type II secretory pathway)